MPLNHPTDWNFEEDFAPLPNEIYNRLVKLADGIARAAKDAKVVYETFKTSLGEHSRSTTTEFAQHDFAVKLRQSARDNGPLTIASFWSGVEALAQRGIVVPSTEQLARKLNDSFLANDYPYEIIGMEIRARLVDARLDTSKTPGDDAGPLAHYALADIPLDQGGFGQVFEATKRTSVAEFKFAVKVLAPLLFPSSSHGQTDQALEHAKRRFEREVNAIARLHHRGIVHYVDAGVSSDGRLFLVMEMIEGKNLFVATRDAGLRKRVELMRDVVDAVAYAHSMNVLHRDLKPSNILVRSSDQQPIIVDFGMAFLWDEMAQGHTLTRVPPGTPGYIPPEVHENPKSRSVQHDVYSCGVILYQLLAGTLPSAGTYQPLATIGDELVPIDAVVQTAIAPADRRFPDASTLRDHLEAALVAWPTQHVGSAQHN